MKRGWVYPGYPLPGLRQVCRFVVGFREIFFTVLIQLSWTWNIRNSLIHLFTLKVALMHLFEIKAPTNRHALSTPMITQSNIFQIRKPRNLLESSKIFKNRNFYEANHFFLSASWPDHEISEKLVASSNLLRILKLTAVKTLISRSGVCMRSRGIDKELYNQGGEWFCPQNIKWSWGVN